MPVTSLGKTLIRGSEATPAAPAPKLPTMPADGPVGHGVTRLKPRPPAYAANAPFIPGTPPPRQETAGAHGDHKGRISIR
jgi:hypothetical protein